jgi:hypothetical protein
MRLCDRQGNVLLQCNVPAPRPASRQRKTATAVVAHQLSWGRLLQRLAAAPGTGSARKARSTSGTTARLAQESGTNAAGVRTRRIALAPMAVARSHRVVFSCCYGEMTSVALEEGGPKEAQYEERSDDVLGENCPDTQAEHTLGLFAARDRGRIWPPRNSLNCGLRSTWSRCHTNRSHGSLRNVAHEHSSEGRHDSINGSVAIE